MTSPRIVTILVLAIIHSQTPSAIGMKQFSVSHEFDLSRSAAREDELILPRVPLTDSRLVYAVELDSKKPDDGSAPELEYTAYSETMNSDHRDELATCAIKLKNYPKALQVEPARIYPFGKDKAILAWYQRKNSYAFKTDAFYKLLIVRFADCSVAEREVYLDRCAQNRDHEPRCLTDLVVKDEDSFEVVFSNWALCGDKFCRARYDADGGVVEAPKAWLYKNHEDNRDFSAYRMTLEPIPDTLQYLLVEKNMQKVMVSLVNRHGWRNKLAEFNSSFDGYEQKLPVSYSISHDITGFTFTDSERTENLAFNSFGRQMDMPRTFKFSGQPKSRILARHNLQDGGFLALVAEYAPHDESYRFKVARYEGAKMSRTGELELADYRCDDLARLVHSKFYEAANGRDEHCMSLADSKLLPSGAETTTERKNLEFRVFCFNDKDFKATF